MAGEVIADRLGIGRKIQDVLKDHTAAITLTDSFMSVIHSPRMRVVLCIVLKTCATERIIKRSSDAVCLTFGGLTKNVVCNGLKSSRSISPMTNYSFKRENSYSYDLTT